MNGGDVITCPTFHVGKGSKPTKRTDRIAMNLKRLPFVADALAKSGCVMKEQFVILNAPPSDNVSCFVLSDANGESFCRLAAPNLAILD